MIKKISNLFIFTIDLFLNFFSRGDVCFITENADWVIKEIGQNISRKLRNDLNIRISSHPYGIRNLIVHFGSVNTFISKKGSLYCHESNKVVMSWFHVAEEKIEKEIINEINEKVDIIHTSCQITKNKLIDFGIEEDKIKIIPLGIDPKIFKKIEEKEKKEIRNRFGIPYDKLTVGSFQKDGNGWGEGNEPKLIKGPDVFCDAIEKINKKRNVFVVLTGPARGYVKNRLKKAGIPFYHSYLKDPKEVAIFYQLIDLYIISSRAEGGPKSVSESMASGVPLISTKVGMAVDYIRDRKNGMLCDVEDVDCLAEKALKVASDKNLRDKLIRGGLKTAKELDISKIAERYYQEIYKKLL